MDRVIKNTSKGFLKKLFKKEHIQQIALTESGFTIFMDRGEEIPLHFKDVKAVKSNFYLDKITPYRTVTIVMNDQKEYSLDLSADRAEIDFVLKHYANYQLGGEIPEDENNISVILQYGLNDDRVELENGNLIEIKRGQKNSYPLSTIEYYRVDKPSNSINIKLKEKKTFITLSAIHVTNVWLVLQILERLAKKKNWPL